MSSFTRDIEYVRRGDLHENVEEFHFYLNDPNEGPFATVPAKNLTNFGSIPKIKIIRRHIKPEKYKNSYALHDALVGEFCDPVYVVDKHGNKRLLTWKESAAWLREGLRAEGCPVVERQIVYLSVKAYGVLVKK